MKTIVISIIIGLIGGYALAWFYAWGNADEKIAELQNDLSEYRTKYDSIKTVARNLDAKVAELDNKGQDYRFRIDSLKNTIANLDQERRSEIRRVAEIDQPYELINELKSTFPVFRNKPMGAIEMENPQTGKSITSFYLPVMVISSFIQDRKDVESFVVQKKAWQEMGLNYESFLGLKDSIIVLKELKAQAYEEGMTYGINKYENLVQDYIKTLKNPPKIEFPTLGSMAIGAAVGVVVGVGASKLTP